MACAGSEAPAFAKTTTFVLQNSERNERNQRIQSPNLVLRLSPSEPSRGIGLDSSLEGNTRSLSAVAGVKELSICREGHSLAHQLIAFLQL